MKLRELLGPPACVHVHGCPSSLCAVAYHGIVSVPRPGNACENSGRTGAVLVSRNGTRALFLAKYRFTIGFNFALSLGIVCS